MEAITQLVISDSHALKMNENVVHLQRMLSTLLVRQSDATISTLERNKIKKSIVALRAGIEAIQCLVYA